MNNQNQIYVKYKAFRKEVVGFSKRKLRTILWDKSEERTAPETDEFNSASLGVYYTLLNATEFIFPYAATVMDSATSQSDICIIPSCLRTRR